MAKRTPISGKTGFVSRPTQKPQRPVRPSQPIAPGTVATSNEGKVATKKVKG
jgi:hypothetical protein